MRIQSVGRGSALAVQVETPIPAGALENARDVAKLPPGRLIVSMGTVGVEASFGIDTAEQAAQVIIDHGDVTRFKTQSQVIAFAGSHYGFGGGKNCRSIPPAPEKSAGTVPVPPKPPSTVMFKQPADALQLPAGRLTLNFKGVRAEVSFTPANVKEAAALIIKNCDTTVFRSQAHVIQVAGNTYGWGTGGGYETL